MPDTLTVAPDFLARVFLMKSAFFSSSLGFDFSGVFEGLGEGEAVSFEGDGGAAGDSSGEGEADAEASGEGSKTDGAADSCALADWEGVPAGFSPHDTTVNRTASIITKKLNLCFITFFLN